jgi:Cytochrome b
MGAADILSGKGEGATPSCVPSAGVRVWDPLVRIFHWTVVAGCLLNFFVLEEGKSWHRITGYVILAAVMTRIVRGFVGTKHARFRDFFPTPARLRRQVRGLLSGREERRLGHTSIAGVMMLTLMTLLLATGITTLDVFRGEKWLEELHEILANSIMVPAFVHAGAAVVESLRHRQNLVWSMVTGWKKA